MELFTLSSAAQTPCYGMAFMVHCNGKGKHMKHIDAPMYGTYTRLHVAVWDSNITVIRRAIKKIDKKHRKAYDKKEERKKFYRWMIAHHNNARNIVTTFKL